MNYCRVAFKVFTKHNRDFVALALKREKLKQKLIIKRRSKVEISKEEKEEINRLDKEIKAEYKRLNKLIEDILK